MKRIAMVPTLLTLGNALCGFAAIACASKLDGSVETQKYFMMSGWFIVAAMMFDALDGYAARLSRTASRFGAELDSLCDGISFGLAPAFLVMRMGPTWNEPLFHNVLAVIAGLYLVCTLMRLARFNVEASLETGSGKRFKGLPSPGAAGCIVTLAILRGNLAVANRLDPVSIRWIEVAASLGALCVALLMVSRVPYPHVTKQVLRGKQRFSTMIQLFVGVSIVVLLHEWALLTLFWGYAIGIPIRVSILRAMKPERLVQEGQVGNDATKPPNERPG